MPFLGITGLDENYERVIAPNDDNDHGLARIIAKNTLEPVCVNIKKNVVQTHDKHVDEPTTNPTTGYPTTYPNTDPPINGLVRLRTFVANAGFNNLLRIPNGVLSSVKTDYMDKYDKKILNTYRINAFSHIVKLMNDLHKSTKKNYG
jgi:hypothetical protein